MCHCEGEGTCDLCPLFLLLLLLCGGLVCPEEDPGTTERVVQQLKLLQQTQTVGVRWTRSYHLFLGHSHSNYFVQDKMLCYKVTTRFSGSKWQSLIFIISVIICWLLVSLSVDTKSPDTSSIDCSCHCLLTLCHCWHTLPIAVSLLTHIAFSSVTVDTHCL